ncbi:MAG TPA: arginine deiminase family protein [Vicinamibacterales bacterium]
MTPNEYGAIRHLAVTHARDAFVDQPTIDRQWEGLAFTGRPEFSRAVAQHDAFIALLRAAGAVVHLLPPSAGTTLDAVYARDASLACPGGIVLCSMGKAARTGEPEAHRRAYTALEPSPPILGRIEPPGTIEGGDVVWLGPRTLAVGVGYRTNAEGIRQLRQLLGTSIDELIEVPLPHWRGPGDVLHLMSLLSPVDEDLAVVYSPLMPVPFRQRLVAMGLSFVEVPEAEFDTMGVNVLTLAPRRCLMLSGNPRTREALERAGASVAEYDGSEISVKGCGGPTCLTRPLMREPR